MKKKILFSALVVVLLSLAALTATNAYFSDKDNSDNTFEFGAVFAAIFEPAWDGVTVNEIDIIARTYSVISPENPSDIALSKNNNDLISGKQIPKNPTVYNFGTEDGYIVAEVTINNRNDLHKIVETIHANKEHAQEIVKTRSTRIYLTDYTEYASSGIFYREYLLEDGELDLLTADDGFGLLESRLCDTALFTKTDAATLDVGSTTYIGTLYTSVSDTNEQIFVYYSEDVDSDTIKLTYFFKKIIPSGGNTGTLFESTNVPYYFTTEDTEALGGYAEVSRYMYADDVAGLNEYEATALRRNLSEEAAPVFTITISAKIIQSEGMPNPETAFALLGY